MNKLCKSKSLYGLFILGFSFLAFSFPSYAANELNKLVIMTENYPPYNFMEQQELKGISTDIMTEILLRSDSGQTKKDIQLMPWARGYNLAQQRPWHALFSTTRTKQREPLFKWVGPFAPTVIGLIARKDSNIKIQDTKDLAKLRIGVVKDDIGQILIKAAKVPDDVIEEVVLNEQNYRKLIAGRIDVIAYEVSASQWGLKLLGESLDKYEVVYELKRGDLYLALQKETPDEVVNTLQSLLNDIKQDGTYAKILQKYGITP